MIRTGYCGSGMHERCLTVVENGTKAPERFVLCSCMCHNNSSDSLAQFMETVGKWPIAEPLNTSHAEMARYVDQVNALLNPRNEHVDQEVPQEED